MSDSCQEYLSGLTQIVEHARAEYLMDFQGSTISMDEFIAMAVASYTGEWYAKRSPPKAFKPDDRKDGGSGIVKLPSETQCESLKANQQAHILLNKLSDCSERYGGYKLPNANFPRKEMINIVFNFIGALRTKT